MQTDIPSIDERLLQAQQNAALLARLHYGATLETGDRLALAIETAAAAACVRLCLETLAHLRAVDAAIPSRILNMDAPDKAVR